MNSCLVVDESAIVRRIFEVLLEPLNFRVVEAETATRALELCETALPDAALISWSLPDDDGITLVQQIRRLPGGERPRLILCPLDRSVTQIESALAAGADECITKPFGIDVLATKLGYLGFEGCDRLETTGRRQISRLAVAGMTVAERTTLRLVAGETLYRKGDPADNAYLVIEGRVEIDGIPLVGPFPLFGDAALLDGAPRGQTAVATEASELAVISRARFQTELSGASSFLRHWIEGAIGRLD